MTTLNYKDTGVDIDNANSFVQYLAKKANINTGFAATYDIGFGPLLVASTDGVGTKAQLALKYANHFNNKTLEWLGVDLVAAVFNDIITTGATPKFLLDYYGTPKLDLTQATALINGIQQGLEYVGASLIGGETAEMTDTYQDNAFDFVGFGIGVVDKNKLIDGRNIESGDVIIGIESSGPHTNGFTLIRKILSDFDFKYEKQHDYIIRNLLKPSITYAHIVESLVGQVEIKAMAHITGGGLLENIPRVLPTKYQATIEAKSWEWPTIFKWIQSAGNVSMDEMYRVFNMGIGYVIIVPEDQVDSANEIICNINTKPGHLIGHVVPYNNNQRCIIS